MKDPSGLAGITDMEVTRGPTSSVAFRVGICGSLVLWVGRIQFRGLGIHPNPPKPYPRPNLSESGNYLFAVKIPIPCERPVSLTCLRVQARWRGGRTWTPLEPVAASSLSVSLHVICCHLSCFIHTSQVSSMSQPVKLIVKLTRIFGAHREPRQYGDGGHGRGGAS
jgi:hypothetical protein